MSIQPKELEEFTERLEKARKLYASLHWRTQHIIEYFRDYRDGARELEARIAELVSDYESITKGNHCPVLFDRAEMGLCVLEDELDALNI